MRVTAKVPLTEPVLAGTVQPVVPLVCVVNVSVEGTQPAWPASTAKPPVPRGLSLESEPIRTGALLVLVMMSTTSD